MNALTAHSAIFPWSGTSPRSLGICIAVLRGMAGKTNEFNIIMFRCRRRNAATYPQLLRPMMVGQSSLLSAIACSSRLRSSSCVSSCIFSSKLLPVVLAKVHTRARLRTTNCTSTKMCVVVCQNDAQHDISTMSAFEVVGCARSGARPLQGCVYPIRIVSLSCTCISHDHCVACMERSLLQYQSNIAFIEQYSNKKRLR